MSGNRFRNWRVAAVVALVGAARCLAGDELEHRHMIYALAITAGYSPAEAKIVSDASWSVDQNDGTLATPEDTTLYSALLAKRVATDPEYAKRLLTDDRALDQEVFASTGLLSRIGPSALEHSLVEDPRSRDGHNAPTLDLVFHQYMKQELTRAKEQGLNEGDTRKLHLILEGMYLHQIVDSFVHPHEAVEGHARGGHGTDFALHNEEAFTQAAFKAMTELRTELPAIRPAADPRMARMGLESTEKQLEFCKGLVGTIASSYDQYTRSLPIVGSWMELSDAERATAAAQVNTAMTRFFSERGSTYEVRVPDFTKIGFDVVHNKDLVVSYGGSRLVTLDSLVPWVLAQPEYKDLVDSVRKDVRGYVQGIVNKVGGVRMDYDQQALLEVLSSGDNAHTPKLLADLDQKLKEAPNQDVSRRLVEDFVTGVKARFREGQLRQPLDGLTAVSLAALVGQAEAFHDRWDELPAALRTPGGLTRIHGFVLAGNDIILVGRREAGVAPVELDDIVVGLRAAWKDNETPLVSLDPDPENLEGDPHVRIMGVPADSGFALSMLEADYAMKRIMTGVQPVDVTGYRTLKDTLSGSHRPFISRFWLYPIQPRVGDIDVSSDRRSALFCAGVQVLSEEMLQMKDGLVGTGETYGVAAAAAESFSQHYEDIAGEQPIFRRLRGLFDVVLMGRVWRLQGVESPLLTRLCALPYRKVSIPRTYAAVHVEVSCNDGTVQALFGGVQAKVGAGRRAWMSAEASGLSEVATRGAALTAAGGLSTELEGVSLRAVTPMLRPDSSSRDFSTAATRLYAGDLPGALSVADRLVEANPWDSESLILRALIQLRRADYAAATTDAQRAREVDPDDRDSAEAAGQVLFECAWLQGRTEDAIRELNASQGRGPQSVGSLLTRGESMALLDKPDEARQAFHQALELDPASALACARMAGLEFSHGSGVLAAKPWVQRAKALDPNLPEVQIVVAQWEEFADIRPDLAEKIARTVWDNKSNGPGVRMQALVILASVSASREKWNDVDKYVGMMTELNAGAPEVLVAAAEIAATWGEKKRAAAYLAQAEKLSPKHPLVLKLQAKLKR